ncbi:MAG: hypothetical protein CM1200mP3_04810 [Chloroflexota bacterium]|nr:MAG: hypothetical protein CM1200mP3_04810 [Chloroflexota bacterium]
MMLVDRPSEKFRVVNQRVRHLTKQRILEMVYSIICLLPERCPQISGLILP